MACSRCGAAKGHYPGCKHYEGKRPGRRAKNEVTCSMCGGTGKSARGNPCGRCDGTGKVRR